MKRKRNYLADGTRRVRPSDRRRETRRRAEREAAAVALLRRIQRDSTEADRGGGAS